MKPRPNWAPDELMGVVRFFGEIKLDARTIGTWEPDRIATFFRGIAMALAASEGAWWSNEWQQDGSGI